MSLSWKASTGATSYHVKRATTSGGPYNTSSHRPAATNYVDTSVTNGTTYYYVVSAVNSAGESANSAQARGTGRPNGECDDHIDPTNTHPFHPNLRDEFLFRNTGAPPQLTFDRDGGNRWTAYNWETNASNAGSDYLYENDDI